MLEDTALPVSSVADNTHSPRLPYQETPDLEWGDWLYAQLNTYNSPLVLDRLDHENDSGHWALVKRCWLMLLGRLLKEGQTQAHMIPSPHLSSFLLHEMQMRWPQLWQLSCGNEVKVKRIIQSLMPWHPWSTDTYLCTFLPFPKSIPVLRVRTLFFGVSSCTWPESLQIYITDHSPFVISWLIVRNTYLGEKKEIFIWPFWHRAPKTLVIS